MSDSTTTPTTPIVDPTSFPDVLSNMTAVLLMISNYYQDTQDRDWLSLIKKRITHRIPPRIPLRKCQVLLNHIKVNFKDNSRSQALIDMIQAEMESRKHTSRLHDYVAVVDFLPLGPARWMHDAMNDGEWYSGQKKKIEQGLPTDMPIDQIHEYMMSRHIDMVKQMDEYNQERRTVNVDTPI